MASPYNCAFAAQVRSRRYVLWQGVLAALAVYLAFVPLFDVLGYEFAFAVGLVASFAAADLAAVWVQRTRSQLPEEPQAPLGVLGLWLRAAALALGLLVLPAILMSLNALRVRQCDFASGFLFYALLPGISALMGTTVGLVSGLLLAGWRRLAIVAAWLFVAASLGLGVWRFYAAPPIFGYDPFAGYFPGTLYDEHIALNTAFYVARVYQAALAALALCVCAAFLDARRLTLRWTRVVHQGALIGAVGTAALAMALSAYSGELGVAVAKDDVARALGGRRDTEHFVIYYPRGASFEPILDAIAKEHELRLAQVSRALGAKVRGKITSFYFSSAAEKARWMGAQGTYVAKPWRREIYLQHEDFPHPTLRHEIAHIVAGEFGDPLFGVSVRYLGWPPFRFNVGLVEGIAVAADWPGGRGARMTPHQSARAMQELGRLPPLARLLSPRFFSFSSAQSYATAGSFVYHLLSRHGADKLRALYLLGGSLGDIAAIYGRPLYDLEKEWQAELLRVPLSDEDREAAREQFRRGGIFQRPCAHAVAQRSAEASVLSARGEAEKAASLLERLCADDPGEPTHELALAQALDRGGQPQAALAIYDRLGEDRERLPVPLRARALLLAADLAARQGRVASARETVEKALSLAVDEATRRNLRIRLLAFDDTQPGSAALRNYLLERGSSPSREPDPLILFAHATELFRTQPGLGAYLQGRLLVLRGAYAQAKERLALAHAAGLADPFVDRENDRLLVSAAYLAGDLTTARAAATRLGDKAQPLPVALEGQDWLERCHFAESGSL